MGPKDPDDHPSSGLMGVMGHQNDQNNLLLCLRGNGLADFIVIQTKLVEMCLAAKCLDNVKENCLRFRNSSDQ